MDPGYPNRTTLSHYWRYLDCFIKLLMLQEVRITAKVSLSLGAGRDEEESSRSGRESGDQQMQGVMRGIRRGGAA